MASDDFSATNNPLASPWASVTGFGALQSTGGLCVKTSGECLMVYSTSTAQRSEATFGTVGATGLQTGPALMDTAGNGYFVVDQPAGLDIVRFTGGVFDTSHGNGGGFHWSTGAAAAMFLEGNDVVVTINGVEARRATDSTYRTGLKPGIQIDSAAGEYTSWTDGAAVVAAPSLFVVRSGIRLN